MQDFNHQQYVPSSLSLVGNGWLEKGIFIYWISDLLWDSFAYAWMGIMHQGRVEMALRCLVSCSKRQGQFLTTKSIQNKWSPFGTLILSHSQKSICATVNICHEETLFGSQFCLKTQKNCLATGPAQKRHPHVNSSVNLALEYIVMSCHAMARGHAIAFLIIHKQLR